MIYRSKPDIALTSDRSNLFLRMKSCTKAHLFYRTQTNTQLNNGELDELKQDQVEKW
ncbi:MAG TPA: hypothetical protein V6D50_08545 [Chroococcales cyanobacterium]